MRSSSDPIRFWSNAFRLVLVLGVIGTGLICLYALAPLQTHAVTDNALGALVTSPFDNEDKPTAPHLAAIDARVFDVPLWYVPPEPIPVKAKEESRRKPPPLRVELIGIVAETDRFLAAVYDPTEDRLLVLSEGDSIQEYAITAINARSVTFKHGDHEQVLSLTEPPPFRIARETPS